MAAEHPEGERGPAPEVRAPRRCRRARPAWRAARRRARGPRSAPPRPRPPPAPTTARGARRRRRPSTAPPSATTAGTVNRSVGPAARELQRRRVVGVAHHPVGEAVREVVHGAVRWHADVPEPDAARHVLHRRERVPALDGPHRRRGARQSGPGSPRSGRITTRRTGVGSKPLHGLLICGQLEMSTSTSHLGAQVHATVRGAEMPSTMPSVPSASDRHVHEPVDVGHEVALAEPAARRPRRGSSRRTRAGAGCGARSAACSTPGCTRRRWCRGRRTSSRRSSSSACPRSTAARLPATRKMLRCATIVSARASSARPGRRRRRAGSRRPGCRRGR